jgi:hypothetical protein
MMSEKKKKKEKKNTPGVCPFLPILALCYLSSSASFWVLFDGDCGFAFFLGIFFDCGTGPLSRFGRGRIGRFGGITRRGGGCALLGGHFEGLRVLDGLAMGWRWGIRWESKLK